MIGDFPREPGAIGGGVESVMLYLGEALGLRTDLELCVVTLDRWGLGDRVLLHNGITAHYVAASPLRGPLHEVGNRKRLAAKLRELDPDLVHAHIAGHYSHAAHSSGKPYVLTLHGIRYLEANLRTGVIDKLYRRHVIRFAEASCIARAQFVISINPFVDQTFGSLVRGQVSHIENPVSDAYFTVPEVQTNHRLLYVGRLTPRKDILTLLKAFRVVKDHLPVMELRLAGALDANSGDGYLDSINTYIEQHDLRGSVALLGNVNEVRVLEEYAESSLVVMSSVLETAPMSISQALAAGRGVVTTDAGGCRYMVQDSVTGRVVPLRDPAALAAAILDSVRNLSILQAMGRAARQAAEVRFRPAAVADATSRLYGRILNRSGQAVSQETDTLQRLL